MPQTLNPAFDAIFKDAHTNHVFTDKPVSESTLRTLWDLSVLPPTAFNAQPARVVFVTSAEGKAKLAPALSAGNLDKTLKAPVTAIVAHDVQFFEFATTVSPHFDFSGFFNTNPAGAEVTAFRNGSLQGAYVILAARALGLTCGPMSGFDNAKLDAAFFPDGRWKSNFLINLGYGDPSGIRPRAPRLSFDQACKIM